MDVTYHFLPIDWSAIAAIAAGLQVILTALFFASVLYARKSLKESQNARTAQVLIWAAEQMDAIKPDIARLDKENPDFHKWDEELRAAANRISVRFQRLGYMARHDLIDKEHFRCMWGLDFIRQWARLADFVVDLRCRNGEPLTVEAGAFSRIDFELLAQEFAAESSVQSRPASQDPS